ncbi:MAG: SEC-C metal-binding domain-containing protein [bacterium]
MTLYETWFKKAYTNEGTINSALWNDFMPKEQGIYENILTNRTNLLEGTVGELSEKFNLPVEYIVGFIDGINEALDQKIEIEKITDTTKLTLKINFEKLYKKMIEYKADHLYRLPQWAEIFTEDKLKILYKGQKSSKTFVREAKIERNDPCICGSGRKYKKCCGAN